MRRPLGYCFVGWIFGESISYLLGVRRAVFIASILVFFIILLEIIVYSSKGSDLLSYSIKKWKEKKCASRQKGETAGGTFFLQIVYVKKCKILFYPPLLFWSFALIASFRFQGEINLPSFYEDIGKEEKISLYLNGKIIGQKKTTSGNSLILDDVFILKDEKKEKIPKKVIVYGVVCEYLMGQRIEVSGEFSLQKEPTNPGEFNSYIYYRAKGIYGSLFCKQVKRIYGVYNPIWELARRIRINLEKIYESLFSGEEAGIVSAIMIGEKNGLSDEIKTLYQENGISHILAISGLHISFIGRKLYKRLRKYHISFFSSALFSASLLLFYGYVVGFSHSAFRAIIMLCMTFLADTIGRSYDLVSAVYFTALLTLVREPFCLFDVGFLLSFGAVLGIGLIFPILQTIFLDKEEEDGKSLSYKIKKSIKESLIFSISIQIVTNPILLFFYYELSTYGILLNLIILPLLSILLPFALLAGIVGSIQLSFGKVFAFFVSLILWIYKSLARFSANLPFSKLVFGNIGEREIIIYIIGMMIILFFLYSRVHIEEMKFLGRLLLYFYIVGFGFLSFGAMVQKHSEMKLIMLDVGQGDGFLMKLPDGINCMIDGGSSSRNKIGSYVLLPALKYYGMGHLDYAFVSHEDSDHISGLIELLEKNYPIKNLVLPYREKEEKEKNYKILLKLAREKRVNLIFFKKGDSIKKRNLKISCLHPKEKNQEGDLNADSMVLSLQYYDFRALFTGDLADGGETAVVEELKGETPYTFLKVAHHGSKKSTFEPFLEEVKPKIAVISCSANNRYGHPGFETLKRLEGVGSKILITKDVGAVEFCIAKTGKILGKKWRKKEAK